MSFLEMKRDASQQKIFSQTLHYLVVLGGKPVWLNPELFSLSC
jgi:hypothetical protein